MGLSATVWVAHLAVALSKFQGPAPAGRQYATPSIRRRRRPQVTYNSTLCDRQVLALHIILHHLGLHPTDAALWIDTTGSLVPARLATLASRSLDKTVRLKSP